MSAPLKILWMVPKWTLPATDGARVATSSLVRNTIAAGAEVDVMCLAGEDEAINPELMKSSWGIKDLFVIVRKSPTLRWAKYWYYLVQLLTKPHIPLTFASFADHEVKSQLKDHLDSKHYDYILLDGLHLGASLPESLKPKIIYRAHNIESDLWLRSFESIRNPILKALFYYQYRLVCKMENSIIHSSHGIAPIAVEDLSFISKLSSPAKKEFIPLGMNFSSPIPQNFGKEIKFLFIGRLDWPPNRDGLKWILKDVWPQVFKRRPNAILKIVGSGDSSWMEEFRNSPGIEFMGLVKDLSAAYEDCHFTIVPVTYGSGTRIKVIESFAMGRRLISTKMGVQGADLDQGDYIEAQTTEDWIETLSQIEFTENHFEQLERSRDKMKDKFCEMKVGAKFYDWLKTV